MSAIKFCIENSVIDRWKHCIADSRKHFIELFLPYPILNWVILYDSIERGDWFENGSGKSKNKTIYDNILNNARYYSAIFFDTTSSRHLLNP